MTSTTVSCSVMIIHIASAGTLLVDLAPADAMAKAPPSLTPDVSMPEEDASSSGESVPGTEPSSSDYSPTEDDIIQNDGEDSEDDGEHSWMAEKIQCQTKNIWYPMHN
ncbi:hypothetical protein KUCAC02_020119 [Chaenocephalus aceratus]|uniref:Uncharacterized protein n=1 Tax=Chaenocephalus aceratus TaxID=36190 RepID=A0ACB9VRP7_CHAAC|nr:hypothetical protein KUCAC02_020119 [Chaenocephalus aceratus]